MTANELVTKVKKIITMYADDAKLQNVYFNPMFATDLYNRVPELKKLGFRFYENAIESDEGKIISGTIKSPDGQSLALGTVVLNGKNIEVQKSLVTIDKLCGFIKDGAVKKIQTDETEVGLEEVEDTEGA